MYPGDDDPEVDALAKKFQERSAAHRADLEGPAFNPEKRVPGQPLVTVGVLPSKPTKNSPRSAGSTREPASASPSPPLPAPPPPTHAPLPAPLPGELAAALLSELRLSRLEREALAQELARLHQDVEKLTQHLGALQDTATIPEWLIEAAGDPRTYDAPDPARKPSGLRLHPAITKGIALVKTRRGLRSRVGATEYVIRLGLAADEKIPSKR